MKKLLSTTAIVTMILGGAMALATRASATPTLGIELEQTGYTTVSSTSTTSPLILSSGIGTFSTNVEVNTLNTDPLSIDLGSTNISTSSGGTLTIIASVSGLTSPVGTNTLSSLVTEHLVSGTGTVSMTSYLSPSDTLYGTTTPLTTITGSGSGSAVETLAAPYALTEVITISSTGAAEWSIDASTAVPEPASIALLGGALAGLGFIRRRRSKSA